MLTEEDRKEIIRSFTVLTPKKLSSYYRIKVCGEFVQTSSSKQIWPSIGAARNAINCHLDRVYYGDHPYVTKPRSPKVREELEKLGIIEYYEINTR